MMNGLRTSRTATSPFLSALLLFLITLVANFYLQPNLFELRALNSNLRIFLPAMLLAAGQAIVVIGGGIDLFGRNGLYDQRRPCYSDSSRVVT